MTEAKRGEEARSADREGKNVPKIEFSGGGSRETSVPLAWPLLVDGADVKEIVVRRLTGGEIAALAEHQSDGEMDNATFLATFTDHPAEVLNALDVDDLDAVSEQVKVFLPRRIREEMENAASRVHLHEPGATSSS
ncbi:MAG: phage tail assembly protein [Alphaproteobacteria bacterium]